MTQQPAQAPETAKAVPPAPVRNPHIMNFCKVLVDKKGEKHEPAILKKLLNDMYRLFEFMLGQNMIEALPENLRKNYLALCEDLTDLSYEKIGDIFDENVPQYQDIMKKTMKQFAEIFMANREFNPQDYPVQLESPATRAE